MAENRKSEEGQGHGIRLRAGVLRVIDEPRHVATERPIVGAVLEQIEDGHSAVAVPIAGRYTALNFVLVPKSISGYQIISY